MIWKVNGKQIAATGGKKPVPLVKVETKDSVTIEAEIKALESERDRKILRECKPEIQLSFPTTQELVDSKDPVMNKHKSDGIRKRAEKLSSLIDSLWA